MHTLRTLVAAILGTAVSAQQAPREPLTGTVFDPSGEPVAGAAIEIWRAGGSGTGFLDLDYKRTFEKVATVKTGANGRFAAQLFVGLPCRIVVDHPPYAHYLYESGMPGLDLPIRLQEPTTLEGTVTGPDGKGTHARIRVWNRATRETVVEGETDDEGRYCFDRSPAGGVRIQITSDLYPSPPWASADLTTTSPTRHDVELEPGTTLRGRVGGTDGKSIAGAMIGEGWTMHRAVYSDAEGHFEMRGMGSEGYTALECQAPGFVRAVIKIEDAKKSPKLMIELDRGQAVNGRVIDRRGAPLKGVYVQVFGSVHDGRDQYHNCISTFTDAEGRYRIDGLREDLLAVLVLRRDGFATKVFALPPAEDDVRNAGTLELPPARIVRGVALDADGKPLAHAQVSIWGFNDDRHSLDPGGELQRRGDDDHSAGWGLLDMYVGRRECRTDHLGRFAFGDISAGTWRVCVYDSRNTIRGRSDHIEVRPDGNPPAVTIETDLE